MGVREVMLYCTVEIACIVVRSPVFSSVEKTFSRQRSCSDIIMLLGEENKNADQPLSPSSTYIERNYAAESANIRIRRRSLRNE